MQLSPFYPILDTALTVRAGLEVVPAAAAILEGGARILQFRHKSHFSREAYGWAEEIAELCRKSGASFVVNDRADIAAILGAGLHLGQEDLAPADARKLLPNGVIGFSTHNGVQLEAAASEPVDYVAFAPIFQPGSKLNPDPVVGLEELHRLRPLTLRPLVAIGGITLETAAAVWRAGADSIAVIGDLFAGGCTYSALRTRAAEWRALGEIPHSV